MLGNMNLEYWFKIDSPHRLAGAFWGYLLRSLWSISDNCEYKRLIWLSISLSCSYKCHKAIIFLRVIGYPFGQFSHAQGVSGLKIIEIISSSFQVFGAYFIRF